MAGRLLRDPDQDGWERSDMPIVCETCLGPNPFVRMQRIEFGGTCHISGRPYTVFRWRPGNDARYKKTIVCQEVAKQKNVCQVCLLDLEYGLPVQVRDQALGLDKGDEPESEVGKEFALTKAMHEGQASSSFAQARPNELLTRLQRTQPYYKRNQARVCSFFVRGECTRGAECPYRHETPTEDKDLANQNIKDRYYGVNDPVANKMMRKMEERSKLTPPEDTSITTLYVGGLSSEVTEQDLRDQFYPFGEIASVRMVISKACAFVTYSTRLAAEKAAEELATTLVVKGTRLRLLWGRPQEQAPEGRERDPMQPSTSGRPGGAGGAPSLVPHHVQQQHGMGHMPPPSGPNFFGLPPGAGAGAPPPVYYPSMDPSQQGSKRGPPGGPDGGPDGGPKRPHMMGGGGPTGYGGGGPGGGYGSGYGRPMHPPPGPGYGGGAPGAGGPPPRPMVPGAGGAPPPAAAAAKPAEEQ